jgi:hypothetical protein
MHFPFRLLSVGSFVLSVCLASACPVRGQDGASTHKRFTNQDVISLVKSGLSEDVIIAKIRTATAASADSVSFDTSVDGLKTLKEANVPDSVVKVMINPAPAPTTVIAASNPVTLDPSLPPPEIGVYWKDGPNFVLLQGQTVSNSKVGGKAGSFFTYGMRNQHWDATLDGPASKNVIKDRRPTFYLYVPDGSDASDYVLIVLNKKSDHREFQIGSFGGVSGGKSGVKKDKEVAVKAEHMGIRVYKITLAEDLKPGEYGFFMGTGQMSTMSGARGGNRSGGAASGRVWDFSIPE